MTNAESLSLLELYRHPVCSELIWSKRPKLLDEESEAQGGELMRPKVPQQI